MNLLDRIRNRLRIATRARSEQESSPYWATAAALANGKEPSPAKLDAIAASMQSIGKTEQDLELDSRLLGELTAVEALIASASDAREKSSAMRAESVAARTKAERLRQEWLQEQQRANDLDHQASASIGAIDQAEQRAANVRRQLAERGHPGFAAAIAGDSEAGRRESAANDLRTRLAKENAALANAEQAQRETEKRREQGHLGEGQSRRDWIDQQRRHIAALERQLAELEAPAEPVSA